MQRTPLVNNSATNQADRRENRLGKRPVSNTITPTVPALTPAQMYSNFEEWIKMCTDNKVNATNTWNFALIDYFHEMTFIREGDSINFQKASCTLDGCVKIYTSRVDSVATETGKLLSGLADSTNAEGDDETRPGAEKRTRKKAHRSEVTLLKDFSSIALKKFDLDFAVDPLFKKTSADFDEGGARGLLLNHLSIDQHCKIIFDASDATIECDTEELDGETVSVEKGRPDDDANLQETNPNDDTDSAEEEEEEEEEDKLMEEDVQETSVADRSTFEQTENIDPMDIDDKPEESIVKEKSIDSESRVEISRLKARLPTMEVLEGLNIVPSLKGFDFFSEKDLEIPTLDQEDELPFENPVEEDMNPFQFDDYGDDGGDFGVDDMDPFAIDDNMNDQDQHNEELDNTEKAYQEPDFLTAMLNNDDQVFNYFDATLQNWAGAEHWKLKRPPPAPKPTDQERKPKKTKQVYQIPFDAEDTDGDEETLFGTTTRLLTLSKDVISKMKQQSVPDDIHFSSKQLLQYFIKPMFPTNQKKKSKDIITKAASDEEPDINFWADQTQDFGDGVDYGDDGDYGDDIPIDFNDPPSQSMMTGNEDTSFFHDNYEDPEVSVLYGDPLITNHNLKKSKPLYVNYARTAKRVDVKKLKDNLWRSLTLEKGDQVDVEEKVHGVQKFSDIVNNLKRMYSPKSLKDISVPFCFICLLHLANEKDLSIVGLNPPGDNDDFVLGEGDWMQNEDILNEVTIIQNVY
ncbi:hypothetical protein INT47_006415 [Mucor saturninus]|uniref:Condensin complex subunit 2 n=1 Tax=Mucor saturninus TaxID=64648 RepID=A0A8H7V8N3_9FUNG|nr:hypothetical protein INT47_006415 [Mucor saturninus]